MTFAPGHVVKLKTGAGPRMVVVELGDFTARAVICQWFTQSGELRKEAISELALVPADEQRER
jgi:uncharacterized protein YodC (DUF2158 family)